MENQENLQVSSNETTQVDQLPKKTADPNNQTESFNPNKDNLYSKIIKFENNTYFLDVRSNQRGKFLKLTERRPKDRQTVILSGKSITVLNKVLEKAISSSDEQEEADEEGNWKTLDTTKLSVHNKTLYFDIMINKYGRSLNVAEVSQSKGKSAVIISEQCWLQLQRALAEITEKYPMFASGTETRPPRSNSKMLKSKKLSLKSKVIFLDYLQNDIGRLLKLSELRKNRRESLFIPQICFEPMIELMSNLQAESYEGEVHGMQDVDLPEIREGSKLVFLSKKELVLEASGDEAQTKRFNFEYRQNDYGKFLKMTEFKDNGRSSSVFLPEDAFEEVKNCLQDFLNLEEEAEEENK